MNNLDSFDKALKDSLENYEMEYDPAQWSRLESRLGKGFNYTWLAVASVLIIAGSVLVYNLIPADTTTETNTVAIHEDMSGKKEMVINTEKPQSNETINEELPTPAVADENEVIPSENEIALQEITSQEIKRNNTNNTEPSNHLQIIPEIEKDKEKEPVLLSENTLVSLPVPAFSIQKSQFCAGEEIVLSATNIPSGVTAVWEFNNGLILNGKTVKTTFDNPGNYSVKVKYVHKASENVSAEKTFEVLSLPEPSFTWEEKVENGKPYIVFNNTSLNGISPKWIFDDGSVSSDQLVKRFYRYKGDYPVKLSLESVNGCKAIAEEIVYIESEYRLFAPNSFSPNGDGQNDYFIPAALKVLDKEFTMTIYDRSNKLVYSSRSADRPWDGRYMDNQQAPSGVYVWMVVVDGEQIYRGSVTLLER